MAIIHLNIPFDNPKIEVNGHEFELLRSDGEIYEDALRIQAKYQTLNADSPEEVLEAVKEASSYVDEILGEGAMKKISGGKPVSMLCAINAMVMIAQAAAQSYASKITEKYE